MLTPEQLEDYKQFRGTPIETLLQHVEEQAATLAERDKALAEKSDEIACINQWIIDLQSGMYINCVYCGHRYGPDPGTPVAMADVLKEHIQVCPKHPCSRLTRELEAARAALRAAQDRVTELEKENHRARVQVPLWKGVASAMVQRAKRIRCQFGGDHSIADCRCDPHQLGDAVFSMQDEIDRAALAGKGETG